MSIISPSTPQAGAPAPAEATTLKTYRCRFAQTMFTLIDVQAPDEDAACELAADRYETEPTSPDFYGDYEMDEVTEAPALRTFHVRLITRGSYDGCVEARSAGDAIERARHIWRTECPHPFERCEDDELADVTAEEVRP